MGLFSRKSDSDDTSSKFFSLRSSGWKGGIDHKGNAVMSRTDKHGNPLPLFEGGSGRGTPDDRNRK